MSHHAGLTGSSGMKPWMPALLDTADTTSQQAILGEVVVGDDWSPTDHTSLLTAEHPIYQIVQNLSGIALLPGRLCAWKSGSRGKAVDGYVTTTAAEVAGAVPYHVPSAGVPANSIFLLLRAGPGWYLTDLAASAANSFAMDGILVALTAVTSQSTTAGRGSAVDFTGATALLANQVINHFGRAMSANTTNQTNRAVRVMFTLLN